jgi:DNA-binding MarR family transcriptional regulator
MKIEFSRRTQSHPAPVGAATAVAAIDDILECFAALTQNLAGWHAPEFLGLDVTMSQAKCLYLVALRPGISMSTLAEHLGVGPSAVSGLVDRLVEHGYLDRRDDPADRRHLQLALTSSGAAVIEHIRELNSHHLRTLLGGLDPTELEAVRTGILALDREALRINQHVATTAAPRLEGKRPA